MPRKKVEQPEAAVLAEETSAVQTETESVEAVASESAPNLSETTEQALPSEPSETNPPDEILAENPASVSEPSQLPPAEEPPAPAPETESAAEPVTEQTSETEPSEPAPVPVPAKKRRTAAKKKAKPAEPKPEPPLPDEEQAAADVSVQKPHLTVRRRSSEPSILTIASGDEVDTPDAQEETAWHEIRNAYRVHRILTGTLGGIEPTDAGKPIAIVNYNDYRVVIPLSEMMINLNEGPNHYGELQLRQSKILGNMIGAEIDFVIKGIDSKSRSIVASRKDAMMRKRKLFYFDTDSQGIYRIYEDRIVQARVIAVAEKVIRVEVFGVECPILARDLSYNWLGDAHEYYNVGDEILVRIQEVKRDSLDALSIRADVKSISGETDRDNLKKCRIQGKYAGTVTDIHRGVVFVRLNIGVNAVAHSCYDSRMPGKKDEVSFAVTHLDEDRNVAVGIITRIMRRKI